MENSRTGNNEVINQLKEHLNIITKIMDDMCNVIYSGEGSKIFDNLNDFISGLDLILARMNYIDPNIDIKKVEMILMNIEKAITIKDHVLLADSLIYELLPILQEWSVILESKHTENE